MGAKVSRVTPKLSDKRRGKAAGKARRKPAAPEAAAPTESGFEMPSVVLQARSASVVQMRVIDLEENGELEFSDSEDSKTETCERDSKKVSKKRALKKRKRKLETVSPSEDYSKKESKWLIFRMLDKLRKNRVSPLPPAGAQPSDLLQPERRRVSKRRLSKAKAAHAGNTASATSVEAEQADESEDSKVLGYDYMDLTDFPWFDPVEEMRLMLHLIDSELEAPRAMLSITERSSKTIIKCLMKASIRAEQDERESSEEVEEEEEGEDSLSRVINDIALGN